MKLIFADPFSDEAVAYQRQAIEAVCGLFRGQEICRSEFTVLRDSGDSQARLGFAENDLGIGNRLTLLDDEILANLNAIQLANGVPKSESLDSSDFTIEMETGTGKTYVYLRTILELYKRFGFLKFVIVVPSVAIKEGVYKTLQITQEHFRAIYAGTPVDFFLYDSDKLGQVRNFATSPTIQIMVVTVGAINKKDVNNLYKQNEKTGDYKPIDLIQATSPIVIVDEPQSVDGGLEGRGKEALAAMHPLCTLRYSATHVDKHHMIYRLDAIDAYERRLVKQIEVASATIADSHNQPFVRMVGVKSQKGSIIATIEVDVDEAGTVRRRERQVRDGDSLDDLTGREIYRNHRIGTISNAAKNKYVELRYPGGELHLKEGETYCDVDPMLIQREMIRRTIKEHLQKELRLTPQGIKVLSLFFIDQVDKYRIRNEDGTVEKGEYAKIFEEEYERAARQPEFKGLFAGVDPGVAAPLAHDGYFSIDRQGGWTDTAENNATNREAAEKAYTLIMKDKERLLSFETPLKFIFSHSALREGWDNPNVFQICSLRDIRTERERRQTIGRGLRLCVNQQGERLRGFDINTLTVVANESYEDFADNLQKEIEADTGIQFGIVKDHDFAQIPTVAPDGTAGLLGYEKSKELWAILKAAGHIDTRGKVQDSLRIAIRDETLVLPPEFMQYRPQVMAKLKKVAGKLDIKNADQRRSLSPRRAVLDGPDFKELWDRIKHRTTYRLHFDNEALIARSIEAVNDSPPIVRTRLEWRKAGIAIGKGGVEATEGAEGSQTVTLEERDLPLPDILTELQNRTQLTRKTIYRILTGSTRLGDFSRNPQLFIQNTGEVITRCKQLAVVDGIKYERLGDSDIWGQELFETKELQSYMTKLVESTKSPYEHIAYDSGPEAAFARELEKNDDVKVYAKLPGWFRVPTPLGDYIPDWAVLVATPTGDRLYFVVETKSSAFLEDLRDKERAKIKCGEKHFEALANGPNPARFQRGKTFAEVLASQEP
jgi:type III restriction enzyme